MVTIKYTKQNILILTIQFTIDTCSKLATYTMTRVHHITLADDDLEGSVIFMITILLITVIMGY